MSLWLESLSPMAKFIINVPFSSDIPNYERWSIPAMTVDIICIIFMTIISSFLIVLVFNLNHDVVVKTGDKCSIYLGIILIKPH